MAGKRQTNPAGSTNNLRGDVLRVLGALNPARHIKGGDAVLDEGE